MVFCNDKNDLRTVVFINVTILILIDGFLQLIDDFKLSDLKIESQSLF